MVPTALSYVVPDGTSYVVSDERDVRRPDNHVVRGARLVRHHAPTRTCRATHTSPSAYTLLPTPRPAPTPGEPPRVRDGAELLLRRGADASYQPTTITYDSGVVTTGLSYASRARRAPSHSIRRRRERERPDRPRRHHQLADERETRPTYKGTGAASKAEPKDTSKESPPADPCRKAGEGRAGSDGVLDPPAGRAEGRGHDQPVLASTRNDRDAAATSPPRPNVLRGEIVKAGTNLPASQLQVVFVDLRGTYPDKIRTTDDKGAFEVFLPNGAG